MTRAARRPRPPRPSASVSIPLDDLDEQRGVRRLGTIGRAVEARLQAEVVGLDRGRERRADAAASIAAPAAVATSNALIAFGGSGAAAAGILGWWRIDVVLQPLERRRTPRAPAPAAARARTRPSRSRASVLANLQPHRSAERLPGGRAASRAGCPSACATRTSRLSPRGGAELVGEIGTEQRVRSAGRARRRRRETRRTARRCRRPARRRRGGPRRRAARRP